MKSVGWLQKANSFVYKPLHCIGGQFQKHSFVLAALPKNICFSSAFPTKCFALLLYALFCTDSVACQLTSWVPLFSPSLKLTSNSCVALCLSNHDTEICLIPNQYNHKITLILLLARRRKLSSVVLSMSTLCWVTDYASFGRDLQCKDEIKGVWRQKTGGNLSHTYSHAMPA